MAVPMTGQVVAQNQNRDLIVSAGKQPQSPGHDAWCEGGPARVHQVPSRALAEDRDHQALGASEKLVQSRSRHRPGGAGPKALL